MSGMTGSPGALLDDLAWRGLIQDSTGIDQLRSHLDSGRRRFYVGFDPTAASLTIGNLLAMSMVMRGARAGLGAVVLFGGGTGLIGDPSGKSVERSLLPTQEAAANVARHQGLMSAIFERAVDADQMPEFVDNAEWLTRINVLDFLRDVGKHFPITEMLRRDSVRRRMDDQDQGVSFTEFSYSLLQSYDFMRLAADRDVTLQMGASDQWGNIVAGIDYVRRTRRVQVHGLTCPLLLRSDGTKFGKTEKGAVWISADRTSAYTLFQFLLNLGDDEARRFALFFSLQDRSVLEKLLARHGESPSDRVLQRHMAQEITTLLHGGEACAKAEAASEALFSGEVAGLDAGMLGDVFADVPTAELPRDGVERGIPIAEFLVSVGAASSRREAREHLGNGAILVNGSKPDAQATIGVDDLLHGSVILVRRGRRDWRVARFT